MNRDREKDSMESSIEASAALIGEELSRARPGVFVKKTSGMYRYSVSESNATVEFYGPHITFGCEGGRWSHWRMGKIIVSGPMRSSSYEVKRIDGKISFNIKKIVSRVLLQVDEYKLKIARDAKSDADRVDAIEVSTAALAGDGWTVGCCYRKTFVKDGDEISVRYEPEPHRLRISMGQYLVRCRPDAAHLYAEALRQFAASIRKLDKINDTEGHGSEGASGG